MIEFRVVPYFLKCKRGGIYSLLPVNQFLVMVVRYEKYIYLFAYLFILGCDHK